MKCQICDREAHGNANYCSFHERAFENLNRKYEVWKKALGLSWKEYLSQIAQNSSTGEWSREVAEHLIRSEEKLNE